MNKKLLAAAVAAAVVASPAAFAESTIYGKFHTSVDMNDVDDRKDNWEMNSRASRLGFKGSEDLGNGLKAIYQAEFSVATDGNDGGSGQDGGDGWGSQRNTFIGLAGDWGTFLVGRHDVPQKMAFYATGNERLGDSIIDINHSNGITGKSNTTIGVFSEFRADNAIAYVSPNFSGFTVTAAMIPGEDSGESVSASTSTSVSPLVTCASATGAVCGTVFVQETSTTSASKNDRDGIADHWSVGTMYKGNGLQVGAGYSSYDMGNDDDQDVMQVGASYTMNNFSFGAQYEDTDNLGGEKDNDYTAWAVTGKYTFGNNAISLVYTDSEQDRATGLNDIETDGWGVAAEHNFSKRTKIYAAYAANTVEEDNESDVDDDRFSLGMIHNF